MAFSALSRETLSGEPGAGIVIRINQPRITAEVTIAFCFIPTLKIPAPIAAHQRGCVKNWPKTRKVVRGLRCMRMLLLVVCVTYPLFDIDYLIDLPFEVDEFFG